jgi:hypothetical protein
MKKDEAETAIRHLVHEWAKARGFIIAPDNHASWSDFKSWLADNHYSRYIDFRATPSADYVAEMWFDDVCKQNWRR